MKRRPLYSALGQALGVAAAAAVLGIAVNFARPAPVPWNGTPAFEQMIPRQLDQVYKAVIEGDCLFIDARPVEFYRQGHILNALSLPLKTPESEVRKTLPQPLPYREIIVYCEDEQCPAADSMARRLKRFGYERIFVLEGGWRAWSQANLPTE